MSVKDLLLSIHPELGFDFQSEAWKSFTQLLNYITHYQNSAGQKSTMWLYHGVGRGRDHTCILQPSYP